MTPSTPTDSLAVLGAGTMGSGIATAALRSGFDVRLVDVAPAVLDRAREAIEARLRRYADDDARHGALTTTTDVAAAVAGVGFVIEAVPEVVEIKQAILEQLVGLPDDVLLATNTSTMQIASLAAMCARPSGMVGMHFFNPAHRMPLVEIIKTAETEQRYVAAAVALAERLGKQPIVVRDEPGFVTSRLGLLLGTEAMRMVDEGVASAHDIDQAMKLGYRHPMGPLELADLVGLDARLNNLKTMHRRTGSPLYQPPACLVQLVDQGKFGRKTGEGFFRYDESGQIIAERPATDAR